MTVRKAMRTMKIIAFALLSLSSSLLYAQRTDTTEVKNGRYGVFERDERGNPLNPVAVYDTTGQLLRHESYRNGLRHGQVINFDSLGRKTWNSSYRRGQRNGPDTVFHPNGNAHWVRRYRNDKAHGMSTTYHPNGRVEWIKPFRADKLFGERILHDSTGSLVEGEYTTRFPLNWGYYNSTCSKGRPYGKLTVYRANGEVSYSGQYENGLAVGEFIFFDPNGHVEHKDYYRKGRFRYSVETD